MFKGRKISRKRYNSLSALDSTLPKYDENAPSAMHLTNHCTRRRDAPLFHLRSQWRGASEFNRSARQ
jgi:hypothetical protein